MVAQQSASALAAARELQRRDDAVAGELEELDELAADVAAVRARAVGVREALSAIPDAAAAVELSLQEALEREVAAHRELGIAEARLAALEAGRRRKEDEVAQAHVEVADARDVLSDSASRVQRLRARTQEIREEERALRDEADALTAQARAVAGRMQASRLVMAAGKGDPGSSLDDLDAWGGRARAALFVTRGSLENERERIVLEASSLAASVLGEAPAGASVALVRRRLERALG